MKGVVIKKGTGRRRGATIGARYSYNGEVSSRRELFEKSSMSGWK